MIEIGRALFVFRLALPEAMEWLFFRSADTWGQASAGAGEPTPVVPLRPTRAAGASLEPTLDARGRDMGEHSRRGARR